MLVDMTDGEPTPWRPGDARRNRPRRPGFLACNGEPRRRIVRSNIRSRLDIERPVSYGSIRQTSSSFRISRRHPDHGDDADRRRWSLRCQADEDRSARRADLPDLVLLLLLHPSSSRARRVSCSTWRPGGSGSGFDPAHESQFVVPEKNRRITITERQPSFTAAASVARWRNPAAPENRSTRWIRFHRPLDRAPAMMSPDLSIKRLTELAVVPRYQSTEAAGMDLHAAIEHRSRLNPALTTRCRWDSRCPYRMDSKPVRERPQQSTWRDSAQSRAQSTRTIGARC